MTPSSRAASLSGENFDGRCRRGWAWQGQGWGKRLSSGGEKIPAEGEQKYFFLTASFIASIGETETETETEQICDDLRRSGIFGIAKSSDFFRPEWPHRRILLRWFFSALFAFNWLLISFAWNHSWWQISVYTFLCANITRSRHFIIIQYSACQSKASWNS